jgi:hypothetical protein
MGDTHRTMSALRSETMFRRRRDVRALRSRGARPSGVSCSPVIDEPDELAPEEIDIETGELVDRTPGGPRRRDPGRSPG